VKEKLKTGVRTLFEAPGLKHKKVLEPQIVDFLNSGTRERTQIDNNRNKPKAISSQNQGKAKKGPLYEVIEEIKTYFNEAMQSLENRESREILEDEELKKTLEALPRIKELYSKYNLDNCAVEDYESKFNAFKTIVEPYLVLKDRLIKKLEDQITLEEQQVDDVLNMQKELLEKKYSVEMIQQLDEEQAQPLREMLNKVENKASEKKREINSVIQDLEHRVEKIKSYSLKELLTPPHKWETITKEVAMPSGKPDEVRITKKVTGRRCKICGKTENTM